MCAFLSVCGQSETPRFSQSHRPLVSEWVWRRVLFKVSMSECECTTACQQINLIDCRFIWLLADKTETALLSFNHGPWLLLILIFLAQVLCSFFFPLILSFLCCCCCWISVRSVSTLYLFRLLNFEKWTDIATIKCMPVHFSKEKIKGNWLSTNYP